MNFFARIADAGQKWPDRIAIEVVRGSGVEQTTYRALLARAAERAAQLERAGVRAGDRVAIQAPNDAEWVAQYLGILQAGAVVVPLDTAYTPPQVETVVHDAGAWRGADVFSSDAVGTGFEPTGSDPADTSAASDLAVILYTSGTTADPKGVALTHANLEAEHAAVLGLVRATAEDAVLGVLPLFHALAQVANLLLPLSIGARVVFLEKVSSSSLLEALQTRGITIFACVPQFFYLIHERVMAEVARRGAAARGLLGAIVRLNAWLRDRAGWNPGARIFRRAHLALGPSMRILITGGSRFDPAIARDLYGLGFSVLNAYGLTETTGAATMMRPGDRFSTSVGHPLATVEIAIAPRQRRPAADAPGGDASGGGNDSDDGEILIRGPIVMRDYFRRPEATAESIDREGWLHTGDLGRLDDDGRLYITGRKKEIIVLASGKNLYPEEIEAHYRQSPFIKELCVLGLSRPGEPAAERVHAVIVPDEAALRQRGAVNVRELIRFEIEGLSVPLPAYKRILTYEIGFAPLPRTTTGKLRRHEIAKHAELRAKTDAAPPAVLSDADRAWIATPAVARLMAIVERHVRSRQTYPGANLELDLGLDSMERVELLTALEAAHGARVSTEARATIFTVRQLVDAVIAAPAAGAREPAAGGFAAEAGDPAAAWAAILAAEADPALVAELSKRKFIRAAIIYGAIRAGALAARLLVGFTVRDRARVPASGALVICPNHQSYLDGVFVAAAMPFAAFRRIFFVGASEYFETRFGAWFARAINIVPVDPDANLVSAMRAGAAGLRAGKVLMLFPEGERTIDGEVKPFRKGAAILASHLDVPILPVGVDGLFDLWPRSRPFAWRRLLRGRSGPVTVAIGEAIRVHAGMYAEGTSVLQSAVAALVARIRAPRGRS